MSYEHSTRAHRRTLKEILAGKVEKKEEIATKAQLPDWTRFKPYVPPPDITHKATRDKLYGHPAFADIAAVLVPGTNEAWKFSYPSMGVGADRTCHNALVDYYSELLESKNQDADVIERCLRHVNNVVCSNGLMSGLVHRLITQLPRVEPTLKPRPAELQVTADLLPFAFTEGDEKKVWSIPLRPDWEDGEVFDLTETADAGAPFMIADRNAKCDATTAARAIKFAEKYIKILEKDDDKLTAMSNYFRDNPGESLFMLKRKMERMTHEAATHKVRPYYVPPFALKLLFMWVAHYVQKSLLNYIQSDKSGSAYKSSWFYGGTTKFISTLVHDTRVSAMADKRVVLKTSCFGDDAIWVIAYPDGSYVVLTPDVSAMDMHVAKAFGGILQGIYAMCYAAHHDNAPLPLLFKRVLKLLCNMAFNTNLHITGTYNMRKLWGLCSGIPLTTIFDMVASCYIVGILKTSMEAGILPGATRFVDAKSFSAEDLDILIKHVEKRVVKETSASFKVGTLVPYSFTGTEEKIEDYPFMFLGVKFKHIERIIKIGDKNVELKGWVPYPGNIEKYAASFVFPTRQKTTGVQTMERIYGLMLAGAWLTPLAPLFRREYDRLLKLKLRPKVVDTSFANFEDVEDISEALLDSSPELPTDDMLAAMYLLEREDFSDMFSALKPSKVLVEVEVPEIGVELEDVQEEELNMLFGAVRVSAQHAGQARLPKPKEVQAGAKYKAPTSALSVKPRKTGPKKGSKLNTAMAQMLEESEVEFDYESESGESPDDYIPDWEQ